MAAPGKALLAGGYLVLDRNYSGGGWVVATTSRFYTRCSGGSTSLSLIPSVLPSTIHVVSPQFTDGEWLWQLARSRDDDDDDGDGVVVLQR